jgi:hypothetical protein
MAAYRSNYFKQISGLLTDVSERPDERQHQAIPRLLGNTNSWVYCRRRIPCSVNVAHVAEICACPTSWPPSVRLLSYCRFGPCRTPRVRRNLLFCPDPENFFAPIRSEQFYTDSDDRSAQFRQCRTLPIPRLLARPRKRAEFASSVVYGCA